jgi:hypothetical protein
VIASVGRLRILRARAGLGFVTLNEAENVSRGHQLILPSLVHSCCNMYWLLGIVMATATAPAVASRSSAKIAFFVVFFALTDPVYELTSEGTFLLTSVLRPGTPTNSSPTDCFTLKVGMRVKSAEVEGMVVGARCSPANHITQYWI